LATNDSQTLEELGFWFEQLWGDKNRTENIRLEINFRDPQLRRLRDEMISS